MVQPMWPERLYGDEQAKLSVGFSSRSLRELLAHEAAVVVVFDAFVWRDGINIAYSPSRSAASFARAVAADTVCRESSDRSLDLRPQPIVVN